MKAAEMLASCDIQHLISRWEVKGEKHPAKFNLSNASILSEADTLKNTQHCIHAWL